MKYNKWFSGLMMLLIVCLADACSDKKITTHETIKKFYDIKNIEYYYLDQYLRSTYQRFLLFK